MNFAIVSGIRVHTTRFGVGTIVRGTHSGAIVSIDRLNGLEVNVPLAEIASVVEQGSGDAQAPEASPPGCAECSTGTPTANETRADASASQEQIVARHSIEALRFGIVPERSIGDVTVGYDELEQWVASQLPSATARPRVCQVHGPFGSGKSHTMAAIRHIAKQRGFVTAHVEVDGSSITLSDPAALLRQLWLTVSADNLDSCTPLVELNLRAVRRGRGKAAVALSRFDRVRSNLLTVDTLQRTDCVDRHAEMMEGLLGCGDEVTAIEAKRRITADTWAWSRTANYADFPVEPKRLIGLRTTDRGSDFADCLLGYSVLARAAGFEGLVITIDEFEVEMATLTSAGLLRLTDVIKALRDSFGSQKPQNTCPIAVFVATVGQQGQLSDVIVDVLVSATDGAQFPLANWSPDAHRSLAKRLFALYCRAYKIEAPLDAALSASICASLDGADVEGSGIIRAYIKRYVSELDALYGPTAA